MMDFLKRSGTGFVFIWIGILVFFCSSAMAADPVSKTVVSKPADKKSVDEKTRQAAVKSLSRLSHAKMEMLMNTVGQTMPESVYNCLCRSDGGGAAMGVGVSYHPEPLEPPDEKYACHKAGPPCMAQGMGCWRFPLPSDPAIWEGCLKSATLNDGRNPVDAVVDAASMMPFDPAEPASGTAAGTAPLARLTPSEKALWEKITDFRNRCLPAISREMEDHVIWSGNGSAIAQQALDIAAASPNSCEAAVAMSFFLKGQAGLYPSEMVVGLIKPWVPYNQVLDLMKPWDLMTADQAAGEAGQFARGQVQDALLGRWSNLKSNIDLLDQQYGKYRANEQFRDASRLFVESRTWSEADLDLYLRRHNRDLQAVDSRIVAIRKKLKQDVQAIYPTDREQAVIGGMFKPPGTQVPNDAPIWQTFFRKRDALAKWAGAQLGPLLNQRTGLVMKKEMLEDYRRPLIQGNCLELMEKMQKNCPGR